MATSAIDIINRSLRLIGVLSSHDTADAQDANDAFNSLNMMLEQWSIEELMCYYLDNSVFNTVIGQASYTIAASGANWTGVRPTEITSAFVRVGQIDYPLQVSSAEEYYGVSMKALQSVPRMLYYQPEYPMGKIFLYPVPQIVYPIGITATHQFTAFTGKNQAVSFPPGYLKALIWNLAVELAPEYGKQLDLITAKKAIDAKALIKGKNSKLPELHMESVYLGKGVTALGGGNGRFNIYTGGF
jgi:hypothetical protein